MSVVSEHDRSCVRAPDSFESEVAADRSVLFSVMFNLRERVAAELFCDREATVRFAPLEGTENILTCWVVQIAGAGSSPADRPSQLRADRYKFAHPTQRNNITKL